MSHPAFVSEVLDRMLDWIREREAIRRRRDAGQPWPWTSVELLREWRWCNVRRMDDKVSRELMECWYPLDADRATQLTAAVLARTVNWTDALMEASEGAKFAPEALPRIRLRLQARAQRGEKVFTGAYIVPGQTGRSKIDTVCDLAETALHRAESIWSPAMKDTWSQLVQLDGLGSFLAGQVVADLAQLRHGEAWPDRATWAPVGPGSARGLNRLLGREVRRAVSQSEFERWLPSVAAAFAAGAPDIFAERRLTNFDVQNCLCECDKALRLAGGEGSVRARYSPPRAQQNLLLD